MDPRFPPVSAEELSAIRLEVSALGMGDGPETPFIRIRSVDEIQIGRDGVMVRMGEGRGGLLLPQVAAERGWNGCTFLEAVCRKAGYDASAWREPEVEMYRFTAQVFHEDGYRVS
jgi:uncharacterized protein (TIGR00296 family)